MIVFTYNGIAFSEEEWTIDTCNSMDESQIIVPSERCQTIKEYMLDESAYIKLE